MIESIAVIKYMHLKQKQQQKKEGVTQDNVLKKLKKVVLSKILAEICETRQVNKSAFTAWLQDPKNE